MGGGGHLPPLARISPPVGTQVATFYYAWLIYCKRNTTQHNTTQHNTTQHNTTQHNTTTQCLKSTRSDFRGSKIQKFPGGACILIKKNVFSKGSKPETTTTLVNKPQYFKMMVPKYDITRRPTLQSKTQLRVYYSSLRVTPGPLATYSAANKRRSAWGGVQ